MRTLSDADKKEVTREEFEEHLFNSKYGIVATDYEADFSPINISPTDLPSNTLAFLRDEILAPFGVSLPIYNAKYTDDEYSSFYQTTLEGLLMSIAQACTATLFTPKQLLYGNKIKYYDRIVQNMSYKMRKEIVEMSQPSALLSNDEQRELLGFEPNGQPTRVSLNYVDASIANAYQLSELYKKNGGTK